MSSEWSVTLLSGRSKALLARVFFLFAYMYLTRCALGYLSSALFDFDGLIRYQRISLRELADHTERIPSVEQLKPSGL